MTVKELMIVLEAMPQDAEVQYFDTWWEGEGYGEHADESMWNEINSITHDIEENTVLLY